eukprot:TRINITY_DN15178_c0_g1_i1.p3 TRINITY_DN15178_c0_g1~~TRINITY_DN15178_c0_g1_i1.p3  ORF type:complete len:140 (-),score=0.97 TRINITY_DN15178_c0_g1_i1:1016-1435(-)
MHACSWSGVMCPLADDASARAGRLNEPRAPAYGASDVVALSTGQQPNERETGVCAEARWMRFGGDRRVKQGGICVSKTVRRTQQVLKHAIAFEPSAVRALCAVCCGGCSRVGNAVVSGHTLHEGSCLIVCASSSLRSTP